MSMRKSRKRRAAKKAAKAWTAMKLAAPIGGAIKEFRRASAGKRSRSRSHSRKPMAMLAGGLGIAGIVAAVKRRRANDDLGFGPPNESVPSHESLTPSKAAAGEAANGGGAEAPDAEQKSEAASGKGSAAGGSESASGKDSAAGGSKSGSGKSSGAGGSESASGKSSGAGGSEGAPGGTSAATAAGEKGEDAG